MCRSLFLSIVLTCMAMAEEPWNQAALEGFVAAHIMEQAHGWQATAWGTWNDDQLDITVLVDDLGDDLRYTITFPEGFVSSWVYVGGSSLWGAHTRWRSAEPALQDDQAIPFRADPPGPGPHVFIFPKAHQNRSFLTFVGWRDGKQRDGRIWLCGFSGLTAIASLPRYAAFPGTG